MVHVDECHPDDKDDFGRTALHIAAYYGFEESTQKLISLNASLNVPDFESGWTPLHRALYHGHLKVSLLLIKAGADLGDNYRSASGEDWKTIVEVKREANRSLKNIKTWRCPIDHDGFSPLDLLSFRLMKTLRKPLSIAIANAPEPHNESVSTSLHAFGKSDFMLGVPLPRAADVVRPKRIESFSENVVSVHASKYHSMALTCAGEVYSWGHGRAGRLGHGHELTCPEPTVINALGFTKIAFLATAENHTLAINTTGVIFSWGSDRYGQLGHNGSCGGENMCLSPRKIDFFKKSRVCGIAAGLTHSLCYTANNEVYAWGSNRHAQLGIRSSEISSLPTGSGPGTALPKRVSLVMVNAGAGQNIGVSIIALAAGSANSLALINGNTSDGCKVGKSTNEVLQWGHGCVTPMKVRFHSKSRRTASEFDSTTNTYSCSHSLRQEIIAVSAGLNHNCALSSSGHLYTWGLGSDQLGHGQEKNQLSSPKIVEALLPENGGGLVVDVCASSTHTCAVTATGDVYSWGSSIELGDVNSTFQPVPRRVVGIKRAVQLASGADHTIVLCSASLPPLPFQSGPHEDVISSGSENSSGQMVPAVKEDEKSQPYSNAAKILSLKSMCELTLADSVDIGNVAHMLEIASTFDARELISYCSSFILKNLDGVLMQCRPNDLDILIEDTLEMHRFRRSSSLARSDSQASLSGDGLRGSKCRARSGTGMSESDLSEADVEHKGDRKLSKGDINLEVATKQMRQVKKKLSAIYDLETKISSGNLDVHCLQLEQKCKLERRHALESELKRLQPILSRLEMEQRVQIKAMETRALVKDKEKEKIDEGCASTQRGTVAQDTVNAQANQTSDENLENNEDQEESTFSCSVSKSTSASCRMRGKKGKRQVISQTLMASCGQPPSFSEWQVIGDSVVSIPFTSTTSTSTNGLQGSKNTKAWGGATSGRKESTPIAFKDMLVAEQKLLPGYINTHTPTKIPTNPVNSSPVHVSSARGKGSSGKKVKVSLAEFIEMEERKISSKIAPWSAPKLTTDHEHCINQSETSLQNSTAKLSFAEIQQEEEQLRVESNIHNLSGNDNPWFISRSQRAESLDIIMAKQSQEKGHNTKQQPEAFALSAQAPEFKMIANKDRKNERIDWGNKQEKVKEKGEKGIKLKNSREKAWNSEGCAYFTDKIKKKRSTHRKEGCRGKAHPTSSSSVK